MLIYLRGFSLDTLDICAFIYGINKLFILLLLFFLEENDLIILNVYILAVKPGPTSFQEIKQEF